jgi:putative hydrolase of HD superfamily
LADPREAALELREDVYEFMNDLLQVLFQIGRLKNVARAGWARKGLPNPESVAEHTFRTAVLALLLAEELGVDSARLTALIVVHDLPESDPEVGDITPYCGITRAEKRKRETAAIEHLCGELPHGEQLLGLWREYDEGQTPEAQAAHQLDALEMAIQAREYEAQFGIDLAEFRASARAKITHPRLIPLLDELDGIR